MRKYAALREYVRGISPGEPDAETRALLDRIVDLEWKSEPADEAGAEARVQEDKALETRFNAYVRERSATTPPPAEARAAPGHAGGARASYAPACVLSLVTIAMAIFGA